MSARFLEGVLCYLRGVQRSDVELIADWTDDRRVTRYLSRGAFPGNTDRAARDYDRAVSASPLDEVELTVCLTDTSKPIGITGLHAFNWISRSAEFRILIGDRTAWSQGVGTEVTRLMSVYAFEILNLNKTYLGVNTSNQGAVQAYLKAGYTVEGVLRQDTFRNSRYYDTTRMSILRTEYDEKWPSWTIAERIRQQFRE